jgi:hypothetical protein
LSGYNGFAAKVVEVQTMSLSPRSGGLTLGRPFKGIDIIGESRVVDSKSNHVDLNSISLLPLGEGPGMRAERTSLLLVSLVG